MGFRLAGWFVWGTCLRFDLVGLVCCLWGWLVVCFETGDLV